MQERETMKMPETVPIKRVTLRSIGEEMLAQLNLEKGLGYTIRQLFLAPGKAIQEYLFEDRNRMTKPLTLVLLVVAIATFLTLHFLTAGLNMENQLKASKLPETLIPAFTLFFKFSQQYYNLVLMSTLPAISLGSFLVFRGAGLYYAEHLIINMYVFSIQTLMQIPFLPFLRDIPWSGAIITATNLAYFFYAYSRIFNADWKETLWKSIVIYLIAQFAQSILLGIMIFVFWLFL